MKHNFNFKNTDNFGHVLYNFADKMERGYDVVKKKGWYYIYIICSQKQMDTIIKKSVAYKIKYLKEDIKEKQEEITKLCDELLNFQIKIF